jgi:septation ring formation regulator EzrA
MSLINTEWVLEAVITLVGGLVVYIWNSTNKSIEKLEASFEAEIAELKAEDKRKHATIWERLGKYEADITEIKEMRGSYAAELKNIEQRMDQIPNHKELCEMLRESEARIEARLITIISAVKK